jgi:Uma2 family endonuclease
MLGTMQEPGEAFEFERRPLRRAEYDRLGQLGFFEDEKVELLDGVIVKMSPIGSLHNDYEALLTDFLAKRLPPHLIARPQCSFALSDISEPEPGIAVVERTKPGGDHPSQALLIIELADSSLPKDLGAKAKLYALGGVPDYWVIDLKTLSIAVHRDPKAGRYTSVERFDRSANVQALLVPEIVVCLDRLHL